MQPKLHINTHKNFKIEYMKGNGMTWKSGVACDRLIWYNFMISYVFFSLSFILLLVWRFYHLNCKELVIRAKWSSWRWWFYLPASLFLRYCSGNLDIGWCAYAFSYRSSRRPRMGAWLFEGFMSHLWNSSGFASG